MGYIIIILIIDLYEVIAKYMINKKVPLNKKIEILKDKFYIWHIKNKGFAYSKFKDFPDIVFLFSSAIFSAVVIFFIRLLRKDGMNFLKTGIAMIIGGALVNIFERGTKRQVTDYIYIKGKNLPIFNISDIFILFGSIISLLSSIFSKK